jgi:tryptophanyl-tRNA synthetase
MNEDQTLLSGIAPSGRLTLGNYLGAIRNWVAHQDQYRCLFPLVDLHAITVRQDPETFADRCRDFVALYLACGVDPEESIVFAQSHVSEHCELAWILQCYTQVGELNRMTQFKDKSRRNKADVNAGLFSYPVLMAADLLLYKATLVPVGEDQRQHLELTRDIAGRFNGLYGPIFPLPEAYIPDAGARIMSLQDPGKKMSKSDDVDANVVTLLDPPDAIARKIKRCVTDSGRDIVADPDKPGVSNLLNILSATTDVSIAALENRYRGQGYGQLKADVADAVIALIEPIQARFGEIRSNAGELDAVLASGADKAREAARTTLADVSDALGLIPR